MIKSLTLTRIGLAVALTLVTAAYGSDADSSSNASDDSTSGEANELPQIVVTTNIIGDLVTQTVGDLAEVEVIMPLGSDPHDFAPSARQAESMENADLLVINGAGFEEGMLDIIESVQASGTPVFAFSDQIELLESTGGHDEHSEEEGEHSEEASYDPHIWTDPSRMITAVEALEAELAEVVDVDAEALASEADAYVAELTALESEMEATLSSITDDQRVLVTNHEVFGYFADRFDFEVVGAVIPSLSTNAEASASEIEELAALITAEGIPAIFGETTQSTQLAEALAAEVGSSVEIVLLYSESLGEPGSGAETYVEMMRTNGELISAALTT